MNRPTMIDTSAWIDYFRNGMDPLADLIDMLIDEDNAFICGIIELELLRGLRKNERNLIEPLLKALNYAEVIREDFIMAGKMLADLGRNGVTISSTDGIIASLCISKKMPLLTLDKDFYLIPELPLVRF